ncbi:MAG: hypothetical protein H6818_18010 [Phycisphaerales bacterium]|nr:hypothetical protein [Phycisphaerales bacterium]MCB9864854.1 hypothetical protein [Phycisphaerales bacterium]
MKRFETQAAYVLGAALPVLETARRGTDFSTIFFYVDDYLAGGLLLWAAIAVTRKHRYGPALLVGAWGVICGGMYYSFFGQIEGFGPTDVSGYSKWTVVTIKGLIGCVALAAWVLSMRRMATSEKA